MPQPQTQIQHPVLITVLVTLASVAVSLTVTQLAMNASGITAPPAIAYYLSGGLPALLVPLTTYPLLIIINRQRQMRAELERLAGSDMLTDLPNRRAFFARAARMMARPAEPTMPLTAMMIDIDRFKAINDRSGHQAGDDTLVRAARTIHAAVAESGARDWIVARFGGDEFSTLVAGLVPSAVARLAERICREARTVGGAEAATVSVGVAFRRDGMDIDQLLRRADEAVYDAKNGGRDRWAFASGDRENALMAPVTAVRAATLLNRPSAADA